MNPRSSTPPVERRQSDELILGLFRANNLLLGWGDKLVADLGLTSARWQLLGAIAFADHPQPVAWLARDLGASRQNIQRIVNDLVRDGFVALEPNPHHKRAHLVVMCPKGKRAYEQAVQRYENQISALFDGVSGRQAKAAIETIIGIRANLQRLSQVED